MRGNTVTAGVLTIGDLVGGGSVVACPPSPLTLVTVGKTIVVGKRVGCAGSGVFVGNGIVVATAATVTLGNASGVAGAGNVGVGGTGVGVLLHANSNSDTRMTRVLNTFFIMTLLRVSCFNCFNYLYSYKIVALNTEPCMTKLQRIIVGNMTK
jgi:hypothetical protein